MTDNPTPAPRASPFEAWWRSRGGSFAFMGHGPRYIAEDVWNAALAEAAAVARSWCDPDTGVSGCACAYGEGQTCTAPDGIADAIKRLEER